MFQAIAELFIVGEKKKSVLKHHSDINTNGRLFYSSGGVAQMVERSLSMREVPGSIPGASIQLFCNSNSYRL